MDGGALCVTTILEQQRQGLLVDSLDFLDTTTIKPLVQLIHREYSYILVILDPFKFDPSAWDHSRVGKGRQITTTTVIRASNFSAKIVMRICYKREWNAHASRMLNITSNLAKLK